MRILSTLSILIAATLTSFGQFSSTPCSAGALPTACAANTINLTSGMTNSGVTNPATANGTGCSSVGSDITAGTIYDYDGWFTTVADASGVVDVYAAIITGDPVVGLYSGPCSSPTLLTCDDDGGAGLDAYINQTGLTPGGTYYVRVWDYNGGTGTYEVTTNGGTPPANDNCSAATGLTVNTAPVSGTNYCATVETSDWNDCESNTENNVWYSFTTTVEGDITVNFTAIDCFGSGIGIDFTLFSGTCGSLGSYDCSSVSASSTGSISVTTAPAGTYFVMVDGDNSGGATSLCDFDIDVDFTGCTADAGTNTSPALITNCAGSDVTTVSATGTVNTYLGADPCIGWGFWVESDPLGVFSGMSGIGNLPTGNNPAGTGGDPNYAGVWTSDLYPLANGETPILPDEANGVTYYIAPITLSNCLTGEITTNCFDIGNVTQLYFNPEIVYTTIIDCFDNTAPGYTQVQLIVGGGTPSVDGSNFTITNLGDGTLSSTTAADGGTVIVTNIPNGGDFNVTITDASGCSETVTISAIDATAYCTICGTDAGTVTETLTGSGTTTGIHHILCYGDVLDIVHNGDYVLPTDPNFCGDASPSPGYQFDAATPGSCNPGIVYGIFTGLASTANPFDDANFTNWGFFGEDQTFTNTGGLIGSLLTDGIPIVDNTFYLYPVTADLTSLDLNGDGYDNWIEDVDGDGCVDAGSPIAITMLNPIIAVVDDNCDGPSITITGGYPEFFPGNYLITNNGLGTVTGTPVTHGETITITGLSNGQSYDLDITDANGCSINVSGTYSFTLPTNSISGLIADYCVGDPADNFTSALSQSTVCYSETQHIAGSDLTQTFTVSFSGVNSNVASGSLSISTYGDLGLSSEYWTVTNESSTSTNIGAVAGTDCSSTFTGSQTYTAANLTTWSADNTIEFDFVGSAAVNPYLCGIDYVEITLEVCESPTYTVSGFNVTDLGSGSGSFNPITVGSTYVYSTATAGGCEYIDSVEVTVNEVPLLSSTIDPVVCAGETILLSDYTPGEANGVPGTGTWYTNAGFTTPASTGAITPTNGQQFYYQYVSTAGSCTDDASITVTVNTLPATPTISSTAATCSADEISTISNYNGTYTYTFSPTGPSVGAGGVISGMTIGTSYTVTANDGTCTSNASASFSNDAMLTTPATPTTTTTAATCSAAGSSTITNYSGALTYAFSPAGPSVGAGGAISGMTNGTSYTVTANNGSCTSSASASFANDAMLVTPATPTISTTAATCSAAGSSTITNYSGALTYTFSPAGPSVGAGGVISGMTLGTSYTVTADNGDCTSSASASFVNDVMLTTPTTPTISTTAATCSAAGSSTITNYSASLTYVFSPAGPSVGAGGAISGMTNGTSYTVTADNGDCSSSASASFVNDAMLVTPSTPTISTTAATCSATGSSTISNYNAALTYAFSPAGPSVGAGGVVSGMTVGTSYTVTADNGDCISSASASFVNDAILTTPATPTISTTAATCSAAGSSTITNYNAALTYVFSPAGPSVGAGGAISGMTNGTSYTVTADNGDCTSSASSSFVNDAMLPSPSVTVSSTAVCEDGSITLTPNSGGTWISNNTSVATVTAGGVVSIVADGSVDFTFTESVNSCSTTTSAVTVNATPSVTVSSTAVCEDGSITLTPNSGGSWISNNTSVATVTAGGVVTIVADGFVDFTFTESVNSCSSTTSSVTVNAVPVLSSVTDPAVCANENEIDLSTLTPSETASVPGTGQWYTGNSNAGSMVSGIQTGVSNGDQFYYEYTATTGGCTDSHTITVTVNTLPTVSANNNGPVCVGQTLTLTGGATGLTYAWSGPNSYASTSMSPTVSSSATVAMDGDYLLIVSDGTCIDSATTTVVVNPLPTIDISGISLNSPSACGATDGSITGIVGVGTATITYSWNGGASSTSGDLTGIGASSNFLLITDGNGCTQNGGPYSISDPSSPAAPTLTPSSASACIGASVTISVASPDPSATYTWSGPNGYTNTGSSITISNIAANQAGNYDVSTTISGCTTGNATAPVVITVNSLPIVDILAPLTVNCNNPVIELDGSNSEQGASITYSWTTADGTLIGSGANDVDSTSTIGTYNLEVTNTTTSCSNDMDVTVIENFDTPTADVTTTNGGQIDCSNPNLVLDGTTSTNQAGGSTGISYIWSTSSGGASIGTSSTLTVNAAGTYFLLVTETSSGCSDETSIVISVDSNIPTAIVTNNVPLTCDSLTITLDGSTSTGSNLSYSWEDSNPSIIGSTSSVLITTPGSYTLTVTDNNNNCSNTAIVNVTQDITTPTVSVVSPLVVDCNNPIVTLDGSSSSQGVNYTYTWSNSGSGTILGTADADLDSTSTADTYTLTVENTTNGCTDFADVVVTIDTVSPIADAGTDVNFPCGVTTIALDGTASSGTGITYDWTGTGNITNGTTDAPSVDATGTFTLTVTSTNGCTDSDQVDVIPDSNAPVADAGADITVTCNDLPWNVTLDGSGSDAGANITYSWTTTSGTGIVTNPTSDSPTVDQEGSYQITVTNTDNNCTATATVNVITDTVAPVADLSGTLSAVITCNSNFVTTLDASSSTGSNLTYSWSTTNGSIATQNNELATVDLDGDYMVTVTADNGCTDTDNITVTFDTISPVVVIATPNDIDCSGSPVTLDATGSTGSNVSFLWDDNTTNSTTTVSTAGTYSVTVTNDNGCSSTGNVTVSDAPGPIADISANPSSGNIPLEVDFINNSTGSNLSYAWDFGDGNSSTVGTPTNTYTETGEYIAILVVTDDNGCSDSDSTIIIVEGESVLIIPNIFSPNGDGENDIFNVEGTNITEIYGTIFNRWGQVMFEFDLLEMGWDGRTTAGLEAAEGTYYYIIDATGADGAVYNYQGPFELVR
ncbi:MAG: gliding motility-associated C-terminal domain-containing protein [Flavobacteriales bacterium]|nr:gliding motility-associated C-terminal domain-containing protein [Flavobacteriales bacterium]